MDPKETFYRQFQTTSESLRQQISQLPTISAAGDERQDAIDAILAGISMLSQAVVDAADYVPAYDQRGYVHAVKELKEDLEQTTSRIAPKKSRFQFKSRAPKGGGGPSSSTPTAVSSSTTTTMIQEDARRYVPSPDYLGGDNKNEASTSSKNSSSSTSHHHQQLNNNIPAAQQKDYNDEISRQDTNTAAAPLFQRRPSFSSAREISLHNHTQKHIILPASAVQAISSAGGATVTNMTNCIIDMSVPTASEPFANMVLKNISASVIVAGHVEGSVHITGVKDSVVVILSRQVRIHECEGVDFYLHCASHPIIEDCRGLRFAPAPGFYATERDTIETNQWDQVYDFKWLKSEHSPNWCILPEEERISREVWDMVQGNVVGSVELDDILKKAGVGKVR
ncbi:Tubulin binding cofactor C domain containing protein [Rhypophila decipiens]